MLNFSNAVFKLKRIDEDEMIKDVKAFLLSDEIILSAYASGRDQVIFTDKRIVSVDVKGITGRRKEFSTLPYSKIVHFTVQTPGFIELNSDSELIISYPNGANIQFEFSGKANILQIAKTISAYVL